MLLLPLLLRPLLLLLLLQLPEGERAEYFSHIQSESPAKEHRKTNFERKTQRGDQSTSPSVPSTPFSSLLLQGSHLPSTRVLHIVSTAGGRGPSLLRATLSHDQETRRTEGFEPSWDRYRRVMKTPKKADIPTLHG